MFELFSPISLFQLNTTYAAEYKFINNHHLTYGAIWLCRTPYIYEQNEETIIEIANLYLGFLKEEKTIVSYSLTIDRFKNPTNHKQSNLILLL